MKKATIAIVGWGILVGGAHAAWDGNPSFETPYTNSWYAWHPAGTGNSTNVTLEGSQSLQFDPNVGGTGQYQLSDYPHQGAVPGVVYTATVSYYIEQLLLPGENLGIGIEWLKLNDAGTAFEFSSINPGVIRGLGAPGTETVGAWEEFTHSDTAPADAEFIMISIQAAGVGTVFYFDQVSVVGDAPIELRREEGNLVIDFSGGGVLQTSTNLVQNNWIDVDGGSVTNGPYVLPEIQDGQFFRIREF